MNLHKYLKYYFHILMFLLGHSQNNFRPWVYISFLIATNFIQFQLDKWYLTFLQ